MRTIWVVAGEVSGDHHAAEVMEEILKQDPNTVFHGAGGPKMEKLSKYPFNNWIEKASVNGIWDVVKIYPWARKKFFEMLQRINSTRPCTLLLVDYPGFNLRLAKAARSRFPHLRIIYYISPQVWAWNRGRIPKMAKFLDLVICIFPFEEQLYASAGLASQFVGHPLIGRLGREYVHNVVRDNHLLALLPGSRQKEVHRIFPVMLRTACLLSVRRPHTKFEAAAASESHAQWMHNKAKKARIPVKIHTGTAYSLMQRARVGIVCSGTATLESAYFGLPHCLVYKTAWLTFGVGYCITKVPFLGIVNILAGKPVVKEFVQHLAEPQGIVHECLKLLNSTRVRHNLVVEFRKIIATLGGPGAAMRAAASILTPNILCTPTKPCLTTTEG